MGYNRKNYIRIKEEYEGKYLEARRQADMRRAEVHATVDGLAEIDKKLANTGLEIMAAAMAQNMAKVEEIKAENQALVSERASLLERAGYPSDYTDIRYECERCGDTGEVDNKICPCMRKKLIEAGFEASGMYDLIKSQSFENFSLEYYRQTADIYSRMSMIYKVLKKYAEEFDGEKAKNIAMFGGTGLGKTHLSSAIAGKVIERGYDVYYVSALDMFADFEQKRFGNSAGSGTEGDTERYFDCDLLIVDDLGTEINNQFTTSCLYNVINTRLNKKRATVISTNLSQDEFRKRYWDRITSRIFGEYLVMPFCGEDIRSQKVKNIVKNK